VFPYWYFICVTILSNEIAKCYRTKPLKMTIDYEGESKVLISSKKKMFLQFNLILNVDLYSF